MSNKMSDTDLRIGEFTTGDLAEAVGVARSVIADWLQRDIITAPQAPGKGKSRKFTLWNVVQAFVADDLSRIGIRFGSIRQIANIVDADIHKFTSYNGIKVDLYYDVTAVIRFDSQGVNSIYRLSSDGSKFNVDGMEFEWKKEGWSPESEEDVMIEIRINLRTAVNRARKALGY